MNKTLLFGSMLVGIASLFTACADDNDSNPTITQPTELLLNQPAYINEEIDLEKTSSLQLSWSQPQYTSDNAPINATYEVQLSPTGLFTVSTDEAEADESGTLTADYIVLDETTKKCQIDLPTSSIDAALVKINGWKDEASVPTSSTTSLRIMSYIQEGTKKLYSVTSNAIQLTVLPYYIELTDAAPIMWYLVGNNILDGSWSDGPGVSSAPMFAVVSTDGYDKKTGTGKIEYLNYFSTDGWKIQPADFNWDYGFMSAGEADKAIYRNAEADAGNIWVGAEGYYRVIVDTKANECTITKEDLSPTVYSAMAISGSFNGWADAEMTPANKSGENHVWYYVLQADEAVELKFKIVGSWDTNWGASSSNEATYGIATAGTASAGGANISVAAGTWIVAFNDITGQYSIIAK